MYNQYLKSKFKIIPKKIDEIKNISKLLKEKEVVLIYQMAKVGSSSIYNPLKEITKKPLFHLHAFDVDKEVHVKGLRRVYQKVKAKVLLKLSKDKKVKIVTLTRDPIARNLSNYFYALDMFIPYTKITNDLEMLKKVFLEKHPHDRPLRWFDDELYKFFGINIYDFDFPKDKGFLIVEKDNISVMVIRMENLNKVSKEIGQFLGYSDFKVKRVNKGSDNWYSQLYKSFKASTSLPKYYIEEMYNSKYTKFFYTDDEIEALKRKWSSNE
ncbi:putative capsular polysaccharide synthesis family protein [Fervidibacillus albus]|uniref:Capsular polysaccharide synthesis family protein n=1 Tax=Fervidibacillus albus TaxID=2980026 RepID=A0A9E8LV53_9BACI|nr:putative capsular polysaccharide synthesis family protein [Fervidibacillus albus]WAA09716.1 putative capsular polysaccharide synthesis family protein [Fervidibacillus albus]